MESIEEWLSLCGHGQGSPLSEASSLSWGVWDGKEWAVWNWKEGIPHTGRVSGSLQGKDELGFMDKAKS